MKKAPEILVFTMACLLFIPLSCSRGRTIETIIFPATPEISTSGRFALVVDPYISMRDQPGPEGITIAHGRRGEVYRVEGNRLVLDDAKNTLWINLGTGWVIESSVQLYSSAEKAGTAAVLFE